MLPTVYLVTGAGRGIGYSFVEQLSAKADTIIYAGVRSFPPALDSPLGRLAAAHPKVVIPIQITSGAIKDNQAAAETMKADAGKVDVIIANAGVFSGLIPILAVTPEQLRSDFDTNAIGTVVLYQAFAALLDVAPGPKFIVISSLAAQITEASPFPLSAYGASKAALNFLVKKIHQEAPNLVAFPIQ